MSGRPQPDKFTISSVIKSLQPGQNRSHTKRALELMDHVSARRETGETAGIHRSTPACMHACTTHGLSLSSSMILRVYDDADVCKGATV